MVYSNFNRIDDDSKMLLFKELMKRFNLYEVYYHQHTSKTWEGYKGRDVNDIYMVCEELFRFFGKYHEEVKDDEPASTGGFNIFIKEGNLYIIYENRPGKQNVSSTDTNALVSAKIDFMTYLRTLKIKKITNEVRGI